MKKLSLGEQLDRAMKNYEIARAELDRLRKLVVLEMSLIKGVWLSRRESEVVAGLVRNLQNKEIADELNIATRTVKFHISSILKKTGCTGRLEIVRALNEEKTNNSCDSIIPIRDMRSASSA